MMDVKYKRNRLFLFLLVICLGLFAYEAAFADGPAFKKVYTEGGSGVFTVVPADSSVTIQNLTGLKKLSNAEYNAIAQLPPLKFSSTSNAPMALPTRVNNAEKIYFRPIFDQGGGSCGQASGVGYTFTYEIDLDRNLSAQVAANQYPHYYTWNFLNGGFGGGSWYFDGWDIIRENGCPNLPTWGGNMTGDNTRWMTGFDNYVSGMHNRTVSYAQIQEVNTPAGIDNLKRWLFDHGTGEAVGGLACFAVLIYNADYVTLAPGTPDAGKTMLIKWGDGGYHAMTIVGYNDGVRYDFNGDGQYTNNIDINGDGVVNVSDWEVGAFLFANSWGTGYVDNGFCYMAYKSIADSDKTGNNALTWNAVHVVMTEPVTNPQMVMKARITYPLRNQLDIYATVTQNGVTLIKEFECFSNQGGSLPMQGSGNNQPIELGLDVSSLFAQIDPNACATFSLNVAESDWAGSTNGTINSFSLVDYTTGTPVEILYTPANVPIADNTLTTLSVNRCPQTASAAVQYCTYNTNWQSNTIYVNVRITNTGTNPINLANLNAKYWYTCEGTASEITNVDWAGVLPSGRYIGPSTLMNIATINQGGQNRVCTISFNSGAGTLQPGETVEVKTRIHKNDWSNYTQTNDYSFGAYSNYVNWLKITVYYQGSKISGTEP